MTQNSDRALRELVQEWREVAAAYHKGGAEGKAEALIECAEELEEQING